VDAGAGPGYDNHERRMSNPMPFLFQRHAGAVPRVISPATVLVMLDANLLARRVRAEHEAWLGEVEGIDLTLTFLRQKREEPERRARITPVELGIPVVTAPR
jgi:hypothetical protein